MTREDPHFPPIALSIISIVLPITVLLLLNSPSAEAANCPAAPAACDIRVDDNDHTFSDLDGKRFFYMADTAWHFSDKNWPCYVDHQNQDRVDCGFADADNRFRPYILARRAQRFNVLQGNLFAPDNGDIIYTNENDESPFYKKNSNQHTNVSWADWDFGRYNDAYFENVHKRIEYMNAQGMVAAIAPSWGWTFQGAHGWKGAELVNLYEYLGGKFADCRIVWLIASNITPRDVLPADLTYAGLHKWEALMAVLRDHDKVAGDAKNHLITLEPNKGFAPYRHQIPGLPPPRPDLPATLDITGMQGQPCASPGWTGVAYHAQDAPLVDQEFNYEEFKYNDNSDCWDDKCDLIKDNPDPKKRCVWFESHYTCNRTQQNFPSCPDSCGCDAYCKPGHHASTDVLRHGAWSIAMRGGYFSYGSGATYSDFVSTTCYNDFITSDGARQMKNLYRFFNNNGWARAKKKTLWDDEDFHPIARKGNAVNEDDKLVMGEPGKQYLLYARSSGAFTKSDGTPMIPDNVKDYGITWKYREWDTTKTDSPAEGSWLDACASHPGICHVENSVCECTTNNIRTGITAFQNDVVILVTNDPLPISCKPSVSIDPGGSGSLRCTVNGDAGIGFVGDIHVSCPAGQPQGITCEATLFPGVEDGGSDTEMVQINVPAGAVAGGFSITIQASTSDQNPPPPEAVTYTDRASVMVRGIQCQAFPDPSRPADWQYADDSEWAQGQGALTVQTADKGTALPQIRTSDVPSGCTDCVTPCTDCSIDADVQIGTQDTKLTLLGWYEDKNNRVELTLDTWNQKIKLIQIADGRLAGKRTRDFAVSTGTVYHLRLESIGHKFIATVSGLPDTIIMRHSQKPFGRPGFRIRHRKSAGGTSLGTFYNMTVCYGCESSCAAECDCTYTPITRAPIPELPQPPEGTPNSDPVTISIGDVSTLEGTGGFETAVFTVSLSHASTHDVGVDYETIDGAALDQDDYIGDLGTLTILSGQTSATVAIPVVSDGIVQSDHTFSVVLSNPDGATIDRAEGVATIVDDDSPEDDDEGPDAEFVVNCPELSVQRGDVRIMNCGVTLYDFLDPDSDIQWACENAESVACSNFESVGNNAISIDVETSLYTPVADFPEFAVEGTAETVTHSGITDLHVVDFQPDCPGAITVARGQYIDSLCLVGISSNWSDPTMPVSWSCSGLPAQASCVFTPNPWSWGQGPGAPTVALRIQTTTNTPPGSYNITITGTSGSQVRTDAVVLNVVTQSTQTYYPVGDAFITGYDYQNQNNGLTTNLRIQQIPRFSHVLLKFSQQDILNGIGAAHIVSATLKLYVETNFNNWPAEGAYVEVHSMTGPWVEYTSGMPPHGVTWNCAEDTNISNGSADCFTQWNGGSYNPAVLSSVQHRNNQTGWVSFNVTSDVQAIKDGRTHYGWLVRKQNSSATGSVDYTSIQGNASYKPRLEVVVQQ